MSKDKKAGHFNGKWGLVTLHPMLPSRNSQVTRARAWGVTEDMMGRHDISALLIDDVRHVERTTSWMPERYELGRFLQAMNDLEMPPGDQMFFATPECVGWSPKLAEQVMTALWDLRMDVYIHAVDGNGPAIYRAGDDLSEFRDTIEHASNNYYQRKHKKKVGKKSQ